MHSSRRVLTAGAAFLLCASVCRADYEAELLGKFQKDNKSAVQKWQQEVEASLTQAAALRTSDPERARKLLQKTLDALEKDAVLPRTERPALTRRLHDEISRLGSLLSDRKEQQERDKLEAARLELHQAKWAPTLRDEGSLQARASFGAPGSATGPGVPDPRVSPPFFTPTFTPFPVNVGFSPTPVVSSDRRWVRLGINTSFTVPKPNFAPVPIFTPTILQGPGKGVTVMPPISVKFGMVAAPAFTTGSINTTAVAPTGGSVNVGGFSSSFASRNEVGTPILGHIPYLSPLFRGIGSGYSTSGLRIAVAPTIIEFDD